MEILESIILGVVQGITEWLPISSKSHLLIAQNLLGVSPPIIYDLMLHMGSLLAVFLFFWKDIWGLINGVIRSDKESLKLAGFIILGTIPIVIVGLLFQDTIKVLLNSLIVMGWCFLLTAFILFMSKYPSTKKNVLTWKNSLIIGISQVLALLPGISRSGTTISTGMMLGVKRDVAARFSFLIFIPAILGATILELKDLHLVESTGVLIVGFLAAFITGYLTLKLLMTIINKNKFSWFSIYCLILGLIILGIAYF
jgi:undecaprenyl-diphosphatase